MSQVVDANLSLALVMNTPYSDQAQALADRRLVKAAQQHAEWIRWIGDF